MQRSKLLVVMSIQKNWGDRRGLIVLLVAGAPGFKRASLLEWGDRRGLNPRQPESQSGALPTELRPPQKYRTQMFTLFRDLFQTFFSLIISVG
jgi:hypothetical protein